MGNRRRMTEDEVAAIERIAGYIYDENAELASKITSREAFIEGFKAGRLYTINQFEDFTSQFERSDV